MLQVKKCTIIVDDEVNARLGGLRPEHLEALWNKFGIFVDGYYHMPAYRDWETDRKSTRLNSSHSAKSRMPSSA